MLKGVLFDVDGVLIDSGAMYRRTWGAWADLRAIDKEQMFAGIHGERGVDTIIRVAPDLSPEAELLTIAGILERFEHSASAYKGAKRLLSAHHDRGGIVTSGPRAPTLARFNRLGLPIPKVVVGGEDVSIGKPHPEPYLRGCDLLGLSPEHCVVVEDAPLGVASGRAAGCYVLAVQTGPCLDASFADEVFDDLPAASRRLTELLEGRPPSLT